MSSKSSLTREDLYDWVLSQGCKQEVIEGLNHTGQSIKIINPKFPKIAYAYLDLPISGKPIPDFAVCKICDDLHIDCPECVKDQSPFVNHLKEKYSDKRITGDS